MASKLRCAGCDEYKPKGEMLMVGGYRVCSQACVQLVISAQRERAITRRLIAQKAKERHDRRLARRETRFRRPATSSTIRRRVKTRDGFRCRWCGRTTDLEVHHVLYVSQGGPDYDSNLITLCLRHHQEAHSDKRRWQPVLLCLLWRHYVDSIYSTVPEVARWLDGQDVLIPDRIEGAS
jgi:5-methylcytosine-specific restriction endonuclease McrA